MTQDKKYTKSEFISSIRSKYPQYNNIDDETLYAKILEKYPVYKNQITEEEEVLKKKEESPFSFESPKSASEQDLSSSDIPAKSVNYWDEGVKKFDSAMLRAKGGVARIPLFLNEFVYSIVLGDEKKDQLNNLTKEEREAFFSSVPSMPGTPSLQPFVKEGTEYFNETKKQAEKIEATLNKFDTSITEDIGDLDLGQAAGRLMSEAIGAVPSMMQAMIPYVGLTSIALGSAATKSDELQESGEDFGFKTTSNALISGIAEGASEAITKRIGTKVFKSLAGKTKDAALKSTTQLLKSIAKDMGAEGASEDISLFASKLADRYISGQEDAFNDALLEFTDTFLIGAVSAGPLSGTGSGATIVRQAAKNRVLNNKIKGTQYKSLTDAFRKENIEQVDEAQLEIAKTKDSKKYIQFDVDKQVQAGVITKQQGDEIIENFDSVANTLKNIEGLDLNKDQESKAINLLKEKKKLEKTVEGKDENLVAPQKKRIEEINQELSKVQEEVAEEDVQSEAVEDVTETELVKPELEPKLTYETSRDTKVTLDEKGRFVSAVDKKTGEERKTKSTVKRAQDELINQKDYTIGKSAFEDVPPSQDVGDPSQFIANESENAQEIAQEYQKKKEEGETLDPVVEAFVGQKYKVKSQNLRDYWSSPDDKKEVLAYLKGEKGQKGLFLDQIAQEISEKVGREVTPQELFDIMKDPRYKSNRAPKESDIVTQLRNRFIEVTGLLATDDQIQKIAEQDPSKLKPVSEPDEAIQEREAKEKEFQVEEKIKEAEEKAKSEREAAVEPETKGIAGRILKTFDSVKKFLNKQYKIHLTAKGLDNDFIYKERQKKNALIRKFANRVERIRKKTNSALKSVPKQDRDAVMKEFDLIFRGKLKSENSSIPLNLRVLANTMRLEIDGLSNQIIESGYFDNSQGIEAVQKNIGSYVNRSYRLFSDSNWENKVSEEVKENARRFFRRQAAQQGRVINEDEIQQQVDEILSKAEGNKYVVIGKDGRIDKDILRRRKDIPAELRALMGEVTNPLENFSNTVAKQAMLLYNYKFQRKIAEAGANTFFTQSRTKENTTQIAKEGNEAYKELAGLWTTPEIAKAFETVKSRNANWDLFVKFSSAIKWGKTVGSIATHMKNILGNHGFVLMNGHLDPKEFLKAGKLVKAEFLGKTTQEQEAFLDELISLGVVKQSTTLGDLTSMYGDRSFEEAYERSIVDKARNVASKKEKLADLFRESKAGKTTKKVVDILNDAYQSEDDFFKVVAFSIEKKRYSDAMYGKEPSKLTKPEAKKVNDTVAEIVKDTYPTYDRVPPIIKRLGRSPILGAFVSFQAESIRTAKNTYRIALNEFRSENPKIKTIGIKRLLSAGAYTSFKMAMATQLSLAASSLISGGDDDDSQEYNDLRKFLAPWAKDSVISIIEKTPGKYTYMDLSANDPHAFLSKLIVAGRSERDSNFSMIKSLQQLGEPFFGKDLVFAFATDAYLIAEDQKLNDKEKTEKIFSEFYKLLEPGTLTSARRLQQAIVDDQKSGKNEIIGFSGYRPVDVDVKKSFSFKSRDLSVQKSVITGAHNRVRYNEKSSDLEIKESLDEANESYVELIRNARDLAQSAIRLGVSPDDVMLSLKANRFNQTDIYYILSDDDDIVFVPSQMRK